MISPGRQRLDIAILLLTLWTPAQAMLAQVECDFAPITDGVGVVSSTMPAISDDGTRIAFSSTADLTGSNADANQEVFLWNAGGFQQLTNTTAPHFNTTPSISDDGSIIAFDSTADLTGGNADNSSEIFLWNGSLSQLTSSSEGSRFPLASADGSVVVFESTANFTGGNPDAGFELFRYQGGVFSQLTDDPTGLFGAFSGNAALNADGTVIAFTSNADHTGQNADGSNEIFVWDSGVLSQLTDGVGGTESSNPSIDAAGSRIAFMSSADLVGTNADGSREIFLWDGATMLQITDLAAGESATSPALSGDGASLVFQSPFDVTGDGTDLNGELFVYRDGATTRVTDQSPPGNFSEGVFDVDGDVIAASGSVDGLSEIQLGACRSTGLTAIPVLDPLGLTLLGSLLAAAALLALRRRA